MRIYCCAATENDELNRQVYQAARQHQRLVYVADTPELCDFYLGAIVSHGELKLSISTNGKSPTFAKRLKQVLEQSLPVETDDLLVNLNAIRNKIDGDFSAKVKQLNHLSLRNNIRIDTS